jgi:hypothetical protein
MIVVDSSALIAILEKEDDHDDEDAQGRTGACCDLAS